MAFAQTHITRQGDTLELICFQAYATLDMLDTLIRANPTLAGLGPVLPMGTPVVLPPKAPSQSTRPTLKLWD
jgi:phage tail protein X